MLIRSAVPSVSRMQVRCGVHESVQKLGKDHTMLHMLAGRNDMT